MTIAHIELPGAAAPRANAACPAAEVDCASDFAAIEPHWLRLQQEGLCTPYQTCAWSRAWCEAMARPQGLEPMLVSCRDRSGRVVAILPLGLARRGGLRIASFLGGKHSNLNMAVFDRDAMARLDAPSLAAILREAARRRGVDLYRFEDQPFAFAGRPNPMALLPRQSSPSSAWRTALLADADATVRALISYEHGKKLRRKERKLGETGSVAYREARDAGEAAAILGAFFAQKAAKLGQLGIADPFAGPDIRAFLRAAANPSAGCQAVSLFALTVGDRVASVFGGAAHGGRFSGMFTSYDPDPALSRNSPGDLLLLHVVRTLCGRGFAVFDLGVGDADYKKDWCPDEEPLFDSLLAMTAKGRAGALAFSTALALKGAAKRSPLATSVFQRLRRLRAGRSGQIGQIGASSSAADAPTMK